MQARFLLGPAGSGKTFRCLAEVRAALARSPDGPPLLFLAPKQATYQLERQLLADPAVPGYTRLRIVSFERLAHFVFEQLGLPEPRMLNEEGRVMVLRALLAKKRDKLKLFRASARLSGFAQEFNLVLRELQRHKLTPDALEKLAGQVHAASGLAGKLHDLAMLLRDYLEWLGMRNLQDADCLLDSAAAALRARSRGESWEAEAGELAIGNRPLAIASLWLDGFADLSPQELDLLAALVPRCERATLAFCLDRASAEKLSWLSTWSVVRKTYEECRKRLNELLDCKVSAELLPRDPVQSRFTNNPALQHLERFWPEPAGNIEYRISNVEDVVRMVVCANPEAEATEAAREIVQFVRKGNRYRDAIVVLRRWEGYYEPLQRVFTRYDIPFFLDRREPVAHHPLAELTRNALRTVAFNWAHEDWFAALKTGLVSADEEDIDRLENEALARGWKRDTWQQPLKINDDPLLAARLERLRKTITPPFQRLELRMASRQNKPTGKELAGALREFWEALEAERQLESWAAANSTSSQFPIPSSVHATVWEQMNAWLDNVELAFADEAVSLREWLPILEAGLANFTVGVIPPALDQVLIGVIDRSRNPEVKLAVVLGLNESVFPAPPEPGMLLNDADRAELERHDISLASNTRQQLGRERYLGYIALTRARERLVVTAATVDAAGQPLNLSPFLSRLRQLFPSLTLGKTSRAPNWHESEHASELIVPLVEMQNAKCKMQNWTELLQLPALAKLSDGLRQLQPPDPAERLSPELAARLYGPALHTSVSRLEQFAACPFKFFVHSGLRAGERQMFELDVREQGSFQHEVLACFHEQLHAEGKRWRDLSPAEARERIHTVAGAMMQSYREGLLQASDEARFTARVLADSLQDFVETLVGWMRGQYEFDPVAVELAFGEDQRSPAWELDLGDGHRLALRGRIDRVDLWRDRDRDEALGVVIDYKSSHKRLDPVLMAAGVQLQLPAYLAVLRHWPDARPLAGVARLIPAGVFYVNLRGKYERGQNRDETLAGAEQARKLAYRHTGRFDVRALRKLDRRPDAKQGDQFNYRITKDGQVHKGSREALAPAEFAAMLDAVETSLKNMGQAIYAGVAAVDPFRKGRTTACDQCEYQSVCRLDPWTHHFRALKKTENETSE